MGKATALVAETLQRWLTAVAFPCVVGSMARSCTRLLCDAGGRHTRACPSWN